MFANRKCIEHRARRGRRAPLLVRDAIALLLVTSSAVAQNPRATVEERSSGEQNSADVAQPNFSMVVSEQQVLSAEGVRSYSEGTRGIVDVRLTRAGDQFVLVGLRAGKTTLLLIMKSGEQRQIVIEVSDPDAPLRTPEALKVDRQDNIRLDFYFVQLQRSNDLRVGLAYPQGISLGKVSAGFDFLTQRFQSATAVVQDQALLRLDLAQAGGWAKVQRQAAVITENGQKTQFEGGGEVNVAVVGALATQIHAIEYGSKIQVLPRYDVENGRLQIALQAEVSDLTDDRGTGAPGRMTSSLDTVVNLQLGQAVVLAGLTSERQVRSKAGIPFLSQLPILGWLFGSEKKDYERIDSVIFIVPSVVDATSQGAKRRIERAFAAYRSFSGQERSMKAIRKNWSAGSTDEHHEQGLPLSRQEQENEVHGGKPGGKE